MRCTPCVELNYPNCCHIFGEHIFCLCNLLSWHIRTIVGRKKGASDGRRWLNNLRKKLLRLKSQIHKSKSKS